VIWDPYNMTSKTARHRRPNFSLVEQILRYFSLPFGEI